MASGGCRTFSCELEGEVVSNASRCTTAGVSGKRIPQWCPTAVWYPWASRAYPVTSAYFSLPSDTIFTSIMKEVVDTTSPFRELRYESLDQATISGGT